jgi:predicted MFS family arabinose efflux permease
VAYAGFGTGTILIVPLAQRSIELQGWRDTYASMGIGCFVLLPLLFIVPWARITAGAARTRVEVPKGATWIALKQAMGSRTYWKIVQLFCFTSLNTFSVITQVVPFLVQSGLTPLEAASTFGAAGMLSILGIMTAGWAGDRIGMRASVTASFSCTFLGIVSLMLLSFTGARWLAFGFIGLFGLAMGARGPIVSSLAAKSFGGPGFSTIYGTMFAWMSMAGALGTFIAGLLYDLTGGYRAGFAFSMVCVLLALAPFWGAKPLGARGA